METITITLRVKTFLEKIPKRLGANYLTSADLASLKESALFMYYSIPAVKKRLGLGQRAKRLILM